MKLIQGGQQVSVTLISGRAVRGRMGGWKPGGLTLFQARNKPVEIAMPEVAKVYQIPGLTRGRRAAWAFGIGFGLGAVVNGAAVATMDRDRSSAGSKTASVAVGAAGSGAFAALLSALIPQTKVLVYAASPRANSE